MLIVVASASANRDNTRCETAFSNCAGPLQRKRQRGCNLEQRGQKQRKPDNTCCIFVFGGGLRCRAGCERKNEDWPEKGF
jgi:hypothetical protein